jgi:ADP-ribose pyrophosphatase YjhB (NUDIX family)
MEKKFLPRKEFDSIFSKVPRLCVDLIITEGKKVLLTKRSISPYKGLWHLPGGGVLHEETIKEALFRIAKSELGIKIVPGRLLGYMEFLREEKDKHSVSLTFNCKVEKGEIPQPLQQANECKFFEKLPKKMVRQQEEFIKDNWNEIFKN